MALELWAPRSLPTLCTKQSEYAQYPTAERRATAAAAVLHTEALHTEAHTGRVAAWRCNRRPAQRHRLSAYQAPRPQNVVYENLAVRFAWSTKCPTYLLTYLTTYLLTYLLRCALPGPPSGVATVPTSS